MTFLIQTPTQLAMHLRGIRLAKGLTQKQLGEKLGLSQTRLARIESDPLSVSVGQLLKVLDALDGRMLLDAGNHTNDLESDQRQENHLGASATSKEDGSASFTKAEW
jgi:HTH-type transcriptional regulator/antitoxin HipB